MWCAECGYELAGVRLLARAADGTLLAETRADHAGQFWLDVPLSAAPRLELADPDFQLSGGRLPVSAGHFAIVLARRLFSVRAILGPQTLPIGLKVSVVLLRGYAGSQRRFQATTPVSSIELGALPPGRYRVYARADGGGRRWHTGPVAFSVGGAASVLALGLLELRTVEGYVRDAGGKPIPGARVRLVGLWGQTELVDEGAPMGELGVVEGPVPPIPLPGALAERRHDTGIPQCAARSDATGHFRIGGARTEGVLRLVADHPEYELLQRVGDQLPQGKAGAPTTPFILVLERAGAIIGQISDPQGQRVVGAQIVLRSRGIERTALSDDDGHFSLSRVHGVCALEISAPGFASSRRELELNKAEVRQLQVKLALAGPELSGQIVDSRLSPLAGATVEGRQGALVLSTRSGRDGAFVLRGFRAGPIVLQARKAGYASAQRRALPGQDVRLELRAQGKIGGRVVDYRTGVILRRFSLRIDGGPWRMVFDRSGRFVVDANAGQHTLEISSSGYSVGRVVVTVGDPSRGERPNDLVVELRERP